MNINMKWRLMAMPVALAALGLPAVACDQSSDLTNLPGTLCCTDFTPGADLSAVDWGIKGGGKTTASFAAFMQAAADFSGAASAAVTDLTAACQELAIDLGAPENMV